MTQPFIFSSASSEEEDEEGPTSPWDFPSEGLKDRLLFILWWPINFTLWYTQGGRLWYHRGTTDHIRGTTVVPRSQTSNFNKIERE